ncbi:MAG TPA: tRNA uridine-5-carboxymethylaminomethyl(34) synthesis GTPase MnmE [Steroidobacteraceae bacterium]|nr:tRNA uridine-5-carboxymethylaminomethyl(34) synthesis GTPase MnmE [Steroidobacteraceae bacterium]
MSAPRDTIVAPATPPGRGGIGIVRVSGPGTRLIATAVLGRLPAPRHATVSVFADNGGHTIDVGLALYFPAPDSFTGEDVLELHGHGGPVVMDLLVARALELGARLARPGEFSERAFHNGKLDLVQAEAIADLISAGSAEAARAALRSLSGVFSAEVHALDTRVMELRAYVEASIDFPDEDAAFLALPEVGERLEDIRGRFAAIAETVRQGRALRDGLHVVIAGRPNAGKSSLLNALAGFDAAIVTEIPGTTRDVLRERIHVDGLPIHVADTAGLRDTEDLIEIEGLRRARMEMGRADLVLYVVDATRGFTPGESASLPAGAATIVVWNKVDLPSALPSPVLEDRPAIAVSALTGAGVPALREQLKSAAGYQSDSGAWSARRRHLDALARAQSLFEVAEGRLGERASFELVAEELRQAHHALGEITGETSSDALLGAVFATFCIGK